MSHPTNWWKSNPEKIHFLVHLSPTAICLAAVCGAFEGWTKRREDHSVPPEDSPALIGQWEILLFWVSRLRKKNVATHEWGAKYNRKCLLGLVNKRDHL